MTGPGKEPDVVPALEVGGTHCAVAVVDTTHWRLVPGTVHRLALRSDGTAEEIIFVILECAHSVDIEPGRRWGVAIPGPFDYESGVARFRDVGKFDALFGLDLRAILLDDAETRPRDVAFVNDADAFLLGEWMAGAAAGHRRAVGLTLGTGIGSAFLIDGTVTEDHPAVPPEGRVDLLTIDGGPLEDTVSRRAIIARYAELTKSADTDVDVRDIAMRDRDGEPEARQVLDRALIALGRTIGPWVERFGATVLVVGGSMAASWDIVLPRLRAGIAQTAPAVVGRTAVVCATRPTEAALIGAGSAAFRRTTTRAVKSGSSHPEKRA
ncbi:ROK family protein [Jiangella asiatica]|uniref:ROK family protein n=1 Tax=Jiangella asiatica TaxID=2530372 RepID=A0A4R5DLJ9_9ACTN|nr:ROK family protein [Jiangella asiatica]TDE14307.1 ROK family protein [Jiangella asiatica]